MSTNGQSQNLPQNVQPERVVRYGQFLDVHLTELSAKRFANLHFSTWIQFFSRACLLALSSLALYPIPHIREGFCLGLLHPRIWDRCFGGWLFC